MAQKTLFSFFTKKSTAPKNDNETNGSPNILTPVQQSKPKASTPGKGKNAAVSVDYKVGDVVWAKLDGFPWWPSLVCNHPTLKTHVKAGKAPHVHVQFFDDPPSRAWIKAKYVAAYKGSECPETERGGQFYTRDEVCLGGMKEADQAMELPQGERLGLVVDLLPSEDEDEEEEKMDFDAEIFDTEMSENEGNSSKENHDLSGSKTPCKSPSKSGRPVRSARKATKRRKIVGLDNEMEDSDDEFKVGSDESGSDDASSGVDESEPDTGSDPESPVKSLKRKRPGVSGVKRSKGTPTSSRNTPRIKRRIASESEDDNDAPSPPTKSSNTPVRELNTSLNTSSFTPTVGQKTKSKLSAFAAKDLIAGSATDTEGRSFVHTTFDCIHPDKIKDREGHTRDHPDYNPRTLYVPDSFLSKQTPGMRQWWELKSKHFDVVLFFKMGKFYELFHMDAAIGVKELGLVFMKGEHAHAGFPEIAFGRYADSLVEKGYKVARIEQTENPDMMNERVKKMLKPTKFDKVVRREICRVTNKATRVYSHLDGDISDAKNAYLLAICEKIEADSGCSTFGVCFVDTSTAKFQMGQFLDDRHHSRLRTLISHYPPAQVLTERGKLSEASREVITNLLPSALHDTLRPGGEFWESTRTLRSLAEDEYFVSEENKEGEGVQWPECLLKMKADSDTLGHTAAEEYDLAIRALGAVIWFLKDSCIDHEILSMKNFAEYIPVDAATVDKTADNCTLPGRRMVLDGVTLANLEILENNFGTTEGSLLARIDTCSTNFGKRLLKHWLCAPLCHHNAINDRLDAMEDVMAIPDVAAEVREKLRKMPDLERLLSKIHTLGSATRSKEHPDGRAIFYEDVVYSKRKIEDFLSVLEGFELARKLLDKFEEPAKSFKSALLKNTVTLVDDGGHFPDMTEQLKFFDQAFDHKQAREKGVIHPRDGVDPEYDQAIADISNTKKELDKYLEAQKKLLSCRTISYFGTAKNRYQLEIPDSVAKNLPHEYTVTSQKKGHKRYWTPEIEAHFARLMEAEDHRDAALRDIMRRIFHSFDKSYQKWSEGVQCLSVLDVLLCLADYSRCGEGVMCRPVMEPPRPDHKPFLEIREGHHPCIGRIFSGGDYIPNDTVVGIQDENVMEEDDSLNCDGSIALVTGPNMGGKSTLMRQVGLITVLAQLGCYVPAEKCCLTPVDRVFTRLGANDRIMAGESTFFVELSETSSILQHASKHSLVLLDELGRGTATFDGTAIASAVIKELSENVGCRTLFSTHYHSLVEDFATDGNVRLGHMACMVENDNDGDPSQETITFLYKFVSGACPKSYGFNAARLADLPEEVIQVAKKRAQELEQSQERLRWFRKLHRLGSNTDGVKKLISAIA